MVDAAEQIVAETGLRALTFHAVQQAANQSNKSAAVYHFGSREGLLESVIESRMEPVNTRRQVMLDQVDQSVESLTIRRVVNILVEPLVDETLRRPGSYYARFLAQAALDPELTELVHKHLLAEGFRRVHQLMAELSPASDEVSAFRSTSVVLFTLIILATHEGRERTTSETNAISAELIDMVVAMLAAPAGAIDHAEGA